MPPTTLNSEEPIKRITTRQRTGISARGLATALSREYAQTTPTGQAKKYP